MHLYSIKFYGFCDYICKGLFQQHSPYIIFPLLQIMYNSDFNSNSDSDSDSVEGEPGAYYGGFGHCYRCGK